MADTQVYGTMCTDIGNAAIANSVLTGTKVNFAQIVVGDGNGTPYVPVSGQTSLKHQVWSGAIAEVMQDPQQVNRMILHAVLPSSVGGWIMREIGVLDDKGQLLAVGNTPEIPKEVVTSGAIMEMDLYIYISVVDARGANVIIDPTVIIATKADINNLWDTVNKLAQSVKLGDNVYAATNAVITLPAADSTHDGYMAKEQAVQLAQAVPNTRKVAGHALTGDVTLSASDVGALGNIEHPRVLTQTRDCVSTNTTIAGDYSTRADKAERAAIIGIGNKSGLWGSYVIGNENVIGRFNEDGTEMAGTASLDCGAYVLGYKNKLELAGKSYSVNHTVIGTNNELMQCDCTSTYGPVTSILDHGSYKAISIGLTSVNPTLWAWAMFMTTGYNNTFKYIHTSAGGLDSYPTSNGDSTYTFYVHSVIPSDLKVGTVLNIRYQANFPDGSGTNYNIGYPTLVLGSWNKVFPCIEKGVVIGEENIAFGSSAYILGKELVSDAKHYTTVYLGQDNKPLTHADSRRPALVVGNGTSDSSRFNALLLTNDGNLYTGGSGTYHTGGADYSEYFEWQDENQNKEDRAGRFVTLDGEKIHYAKQGDEILGIISASPAIVGDDFSESWYGKYETDIFGRVQTEEYTVPEEVIPADKETGEAERTIPSHTEMRMKLNPNFDATKDAAYQTRSSRPEWSTVGMIGKLVLIDDGTCAVNGYCQPSAAGDGTATKADGKTNCRVMARLDSTHIKVLLK